MQNGEQTRHVINPIGGSPGDRTSQVISSIVRTSLFFLPNHRSRSHSVSNVWTSPTGVQPPVLATEVVGRGARPTSPANDVGMHANVVGTPSTGVCPPMVVVCIAWAVEKSRQASRSNGGGQADIPSPDQLRVRSMIHDRWNIAMFQHREQ